MSDRIAQAGHVAGLGALLLGAALAAPPLAARAEPSPPPLAAGLAPGPDGTPTVWGLPAPVAAEALRPVTRERRLPLDYEPAGLVACHGVRVRALVVPDLEALLAAAAAAEVRLQPVSGYRGAATQAALWAAATAAAAGAPVDDVAEPGASQHQLGTALDFAPLDVSFADTPAGRWLWANAGSYGFVFPYPPASPGRSGVAWEPWQVRWVGRPLAAALGAAGYQASTTWSVDDALAVLAAEPPAPAVVGRPGAAAARAAGPRGPL